MRNGQDSKPLPEDNLLKILESLAKLCAILAGVLMTIITLLTCASIVGRELVDKTVPGDFELVGLATGTAVAFFMPLCQICRGNIVVDFFTAKAPRKVNAVLDRLGATPVGMPLPQIPDALSKGTINGCVIPWEVVPSVKVNELTKFHAEFDPAGDSLYTTTFVMAMNKAKYNSLAPDLKKVIDNNSGMATSAWLGKVQQGNDVPGRKSASDRGNIIYTVNASEAQEFRRKSRTVEMEWVEDMNKKGFDGKKLLAMARSLIEKHTKTTRA